MLARDWTALGLRLIGVYVLVMALRSLVGVVASKMEWFEFELGPEYASYYLLHAAVDAVLGLALIRKAEALAGLAIGSPPNPAEPPPESAPDEFSAP